MSGLPFLKSNCFYTQSKKFEKKFNFVADSNFVPLELFSSPFLFSTKEYFDKIGIKFESIRENHYFKFKRILLTVKFAV